MALKPIYARFDHGEDHWVWGLDQEQFGKVAAGYACGRCLEDFGGKWLAVCPVCREPTAAPRVVDLPDEWRKQG
jgi:hypothetical protein